MADLGALRTFITKFQEALDILDEGERIAATIESRRQELSAVTQAWQDERAKVEAIRQSLPDVVAAKQAAEATVAAARRAAAEAVQAAQQSAAEAQGRLEADFHAQKDRAHQAIALVEVALKERTATLEALEQKLAAVRATMRDLAASVH